MGLPKRFERPRITDSAPSRSAPASCRSRITPRGVHGRSPTIPMARRPALSTVRPSMSFSGMIRFVSSGPSRWSGTGSWQRMPLTSGSALSCSMRATASSWLVSAGSVCPIERMPTSSHARCLLPT